jgi:membrane protein involved in colicin uptake
MSNFTFNSAPSGNNGLRGITRQIGAVLGLSQLRGGGGKSGSGLNYAQQKDLLTQKQEHETNLAGVNAQHDLMGKVHGNVLGEMSADAAATRTKKAEATKARRAAKAARVAAETTKADREHDYAQRKADRENIFNTLGATDTSKFKAINLNSGSATFHPQRKGQQYTDLPDVDY